MYQIRPYQPGEEPQLRELFYNTIRNVNLGDYSAEQCAAWAPTRFDINVWTRRMAQSEPFVAVHNEQIVGFADVQADGYIDYFFCHQDYQGKGVGKALMQHLLKMGRRYGVKRFYANVSITAKPFFLRSGFNIVTEQQVEIHGVTLTNFVMEKRVS